MFARLVQALVASCAVITPAARAQDYPNKPIRMIVPFAPGIPTLDELGVKGYDASNWYAIATAAGTPRPIVMKLHEELARCFTSPDMQKQMTAMGAILDVKTPDEMRKLIPVEIAKWTKVATDARMPRTDQ